MPNNPDSGTPEPIEGQPTPKIEEGGASAELEATLKKALEPFTKDLEELKSQQRALQGDKDRGNKRVEDKLEKVLAEWESAKKLGISQEEFISRKEESERLTRIEEALASMTAPAKPSGGTETSGALSLAKAIAEAANISEADPDYLAVLVKHQNDPVSLAKELSALAVSRASKLSPTSAQAPAPVGKPIGAPDANHLVREYQEKVIALRGNKNAILALKTEYKSKGVPVDQVSFTIK